MTYDFVMGQLRLALIAFLSYATGRGWLSTSDAGAITNILTPLALIAAPVLWSWSANWRKKYVPSQSTVTDPSTGKIIATLFVCVMAYALFVPRSFASDLPPQITKAPAISNPCTPASCTGAYVGFGIGGNGSNVNVIGNGINGSVFAGGVIPSFDAGYIYWQNAWLFGAEVSLGYHLNSGVSVNGVGANDNGLFAYQVARVGGNLSALFGGQQPVTTIPPSLSNALIAPYVQIGIAEHQFAGFWASGLASGAGALFDIGPRAFIDLSYLNVQYNAPKSGALAPSSQNIVKLGFNYKF